MLVFVVILLSLLLLVADYAGMLGPLRGMATSLLAPVLQRFSQVRDTVTGVGQELSDMQQLRARVQELEAENSRLKQQSIASQTLVQENARLRTQLDIQQQRPWKLLGVDVSTQTPDEGRQVLIIAAGSQEHIKPGMAVIAKEGSSPESLIGVVEEVGPHSASVVLITDFASAISALVYHDNSATEGLVQGRWQRGSRLWLEQVDRSVPLTVGDVVVTAGLTSQLDTDLPRAAIPKGVPIGTVEQLKGDVLSQGAELRPFIDPDQVRYVWVILSQDG